MTYITFDILTGAAEFSRNPETLQILAPLYDRADMVRLTEIRLDPTQGAFFIEWRVDVRTYSGKILFAAGTVVDATIYRAVDQMIPNHLLERPREPLLYSSYERAVQNEIRFVEELRKIGAEFTERGEHES